MASAVLLTGSDLVNAVVAVGHVDADRVGCRHPVAAADLYPVVPSGDVHQVSAVRPVDPVRVGFVCDARIIELPTQHWLSSVVVLDDDPVRTESSGDV